MEYSCLSDYHAHDHTISGDVGSDPDHMYSAESDEIEYQYSGFSRLILSQLNTTHNLFLVLIQLQYTQWKKNPASTKCLVLKVMPLLKINLYFQIKQTFVKEDRIETCVSTLTN